MKMPLSHGKLAWFEIMAGPRLLSSKALSNGAALVFMVLVLPH
jgi:hypothetical protein